MEGYKGFLTSNRAGGRSLRSKTCCDDIYEFEIARISANLVVGVFDDAKKPLNGTSIGLIEMQNNRPGKIDSRSNANGNRYEFPLALDMPYKIVVSKEGYHPDSTTITTANLKENKTFEHRFYLKAKPVPPPVPEYDTITQEKPIVLENILYDFDKDVIKPESEPDLQVVYELMTEYPDMVIELGSHTDNRGNDAYNKDLSQRRAESARRWLMRKGIARERINAVGYGESVPQTMTAKVAAENNFLKEGDVLTPEYIEKLASEEQKEAAHALNRRTEFKIVKGPTSIIIKSTRLRKVDPTTKTAPNKQSQPAAAPAKPAQSSAPVMEFKEKFVDFGAVKKGEKREHAYEFTNKGTTDIVISLVSACDCTTVQYPEKPIKPGEKGIVHVVFDSTEKDQPEVIDVDIFLDYTDPVTEMPAIVRLQYKFDLVK
jgi:peptidoglycan-associated lipoprotein